MTNKPCCWKCDRGDEGIDGNWHPACANTACACHTSTETKEELDPESDRILELFFNDVVESTIRYVKGKGYGQDPTTFFKEQLGHWEGNLARHIKSLLSERDKFWESQEMGVASNCWECEKVAREDEVKRIRDAFTELGKTKDAALRSHGLREGTPILFTYEEVLTIVNGLNLPIN